ncbi:MAG: phosphate signaling complex protein PhoU [Kiritimatiellae bacterium]|nr:phosphate signaling complex protein PhoU [Kiritimatiellia bacterium]
MKNLEELISENACRAETAVKTALKAVKTGDAVSAEGVSDGDRAIDVAENMIEEESLEILALYQPVAADLRRIATILKANGEIERAGDLASGIANRVRDMATAKPRTPWDFSEISGLASDMFTKALESLMNDDETAAEEVIGDDDRVDELHRASYSRVAKCIAEDPGASAYYLSALTVSRCLERLADIATNIAEDVIYLKTAEIVRHRPQPSRPGSF